MPVNFKQTIVPSGGFFKYHAITPPPPVSKRPFFSVIIPVHERIIYLRRALASVLNQDFDHEELDIHIVDNYSQTVDVAAIVREFNSPRIRFHRQNQLCTAAENWCSMIDRAAGHFIHILHDDDLVLPGFYAEGKRIIEAHNCTMLGGPVIIIDKDERWLQITKPFGRLDGSFPDAPQAFWGEHFFWTPSVIVARSAYESRGGFSSDLISIGDWEMWSRIVDVGPVGYFQRPYALYRVHTANSTSSGKLHIAAMEEFALMHKLMSTRYHDPQELRIIDQALRYRAAGNGAFVCAHNIIAGRWFRVMSSLAQTISLNPSPHTLISIFLRWRQLKFQIPAI